MMVRKRYKAERRSILDYRFDFGYIKNICGCILIKIRTCFRQIKFQYKVVSRGILDYRFKLRYNSFLEEFWTIIGVPNSQSIILYRSRINLISKAKMDVK